jgi:hypothetical protein
MQTFNASSISIKLHIPVDINSGLFLDAKYANKLRLVVSEDAIFVS